MLLQLRQADILWWNSNLSEHEHQLHKLIGRRILPFECRDEIEAYRAKILDREDGAINNNAGTKRKKGDIIIGEHNLKRKAGMGNNTTSTNSGRGKKRGKQSTANTRGNASKNGQSKSSTTKQQSSKSSSLGPKDIASNTNTSTGDGNDATDNKEKKLKLLREQGKWIMGKSIQLCYKMDDIEKSSAATLIFRPKDITEETDADTLDVDGIQVEKQAASPVAPDNATKNTEKLSSDKDDDEEEKIVPLASFRKWTKIKKRLNVWVFRFDPNDSTDLSVSEGGGFPRPELLPLSDIFRSVDDGVVE